MFGGEIFIFPKTKKLEHMPGHFQEHEHHFLHGFNRELTELYAASVIRGFALTLIAIFEPIYLYIIFDHSFFKTFLFLGVSYLLTALWVPFGGKTLARIGVKHTMLISLPFVFVYYLGLWQYEALGFFIILLPAFFAAYTVLYWVAFHFDFARFSDHKQRGRHMSYSYIIISAVASVAPFVGGFVIHRSGFPMLFAIVLSLLFASMIPLFLSKEIHGVYHDSYFKTFGSILKRENRPKMLGFASAGAEVVIQSKVWPLFLFTIAIGFETLGGIMTASLVVGMLFFFYVGRLSDRIGTQRLLLVGGILNAVLWPIKVFVATPLNAFLAQTLHSFGRSAVHIPFGALFYDWANEYEGGRERAIILRSMALNGMGGIILILFAIIFAFTDKLYIAFPIGSVFALGMIFTIKKIQHGTPPQEVQEAPPGQQ